MTGFALTKFDRALAQIDRALAGELTLPVGGPVVEPFEAPSVRRQEEIEKALSD